MIFQRKGIMIVLSAPSGTGKTFLANKILERDRFISISISATTRTKRNNEINNKHYFFTNKEQFQNDIMNNQFLEYAKIYNEFYGTPKQDVLKKINQGKDVLFDIDWQGCQQLYTLAKNDVISIFLLPPSKAELYKRLYLRNQDDKLAIQRRMSRVDTEIGYWHHYDYIIINDSVEQSLNQLLTIIHAERLKKKRQKGFNNFISQFITQNT